MKYPSIQSSIRVPGWWVSPDKHFEYCSLAKEFYPMYYLIHRDTHTAIRILHQDYHSYPDRIDLEQFPDRLVELAEIALAEGIQSMKLRAGPSLDGSGVIELDRNNDPFHMRSIVRPSLRPPPQPNHSKIHRIEIPFLRYAVTFTTTKLQNNPSPPLLDIQQIHAYNSDALPFMKPTSSWSHDLYHRKSGLGRMRTLIFYNKCYWMLNWSRLCGVPTSPIQRQLDNHIRLQMGGCQYVLPVSHLVTQEAYFHPRLDEAVHPISLTSKITAYLQPFLGAHAHWWHPHEWSKEEKEVLALALIVAEIEGHGLGLTNLKPSTILLDPKSGTMKILDLVPGNRSPWYTAKVLTDGHRDYDGNITEIDIPPSFTVYNVGRAILELLSETQRPVTEGEKDEFNAALSSYEVSSWLADVVRDCHYGSGQGGRYASMHDLLRSIPPKQMKGLHRRLRKLIEKRARRLEQMGSHWTETFLGIQKPRSKHPVLPWAPDFRKRESDGKGRSDAEKNMDSLEKEQIRRRNQPETYQLE